MPKRSREKTAFPRIDNGQTFSTFRLVPVINQKNYFTNYLKKDSQYLCRKIRDRPEGDESTTAVFHIGSNYLRVGLNSETEPITLPFCVSKPKEARKTPKQEVPTELATDLSSDPVGGQGLTPDSELDLNILADIRQSFVERMKYYKTRVVPSASDSCQSFNSRQKGEPAADGAVMTGSVDSVEAISADSELQKNLSSGKDAPLKYFCSNATPPPTHSLYWPLVRGQLNEDPEIYSSVQELVADIHDILFYATYSERGMNLQEANDAVLCIPGMLDRGALNIFVAQLFAIGFAHVAIIEEAVAATYGAGVSGACVVDIGAETTTVACVDEGLCISDSRVHLDFGSRDLTCVFGALLNEISFPGNPDFNALDALKREYLTANEADISVQLFRYYNNKKKYDFKVYNEVMLPVLSLFYPRLLAPAPANGRKSLVPAQLDPYTSRAAGPFSDADINVRKNRLAVNNMHYAEVSGEANSEAVVEARLAAFEELDTSLPAVCALDAAVIESISQAAKHAGSTKTYYENLLVVGGGSKIPSFPLLLTDRLGMWRHKESSEASVLPVPQGMDAEWVSWRGGCVYSKLKIVDEMWTSKTEWDVLGSRALYYKAALYSY